MDKKNLVWNTDLIETMEFGNLIGQAAQGPYSNDTCNESRGTRERESRRFTERNNKQLMKHVLTIGSQTRGGSTSCVEKPIGDRSTVGRSDEPCVISETCVLKCCKTLKMQRAGCGHSRQRKRRANLQPEPESSSSGDLRILRSIQSAVQRTQEGGNQENSRFECVEPRVVRSFSQDRQGHSRDHVLKYCERTLYKT